MPRSVKKGPFINDKLLLKIEVMNSRGEKKVIKTWSRASTIASAQASVRADPSACSSFKAPPMIAASHGE